MNSDDNDKLWELLGKTRPPAVSPFFSRNVLRAIRQEGQQCQDGPLRRSLFGRGRVFLSRLHRWTWQFAIAGTCAVAALITVAPTAFVRHHHAAPVQAGVERQIVANPDYEVITHLDELVADEESSLWLDDSAHDSAH
jgi:hypothetical protein